MAAENLEVRVRWRELGTVSDPVRIHADPDDISELLKHLETIARDWRNLDRGTAWMTEYELQVKSLERRWLEFTVAGQARK
jgi:hypothetical protein